MVGRIFEKQGQPLFISRKKRTIVADSARIEPRSDRDREVSTPLANPNL
jgi:hypothetical protein